MASLLRGRKLLRRDGSAATAEALEGKVVLLYFSASWCPPCHRFTPVLADFYEEVKDAGGSIEIVYVPSDETRDEMMKYFDETTAEINTRTAEELETDLLLPMEMAIQQGQPDGLRDL